jgi:signal transduction histidine kinase
VTLDRNRLPGSDDPARLLAVPAGGNVIVVGSSTETRAETLGSLFAELLIAAPVALLLASLLAYALATAALRPVESMRRRAEAIDHGGRLPVPDADDEIARLGMTLNDMLARLDAALQRERSFVADASHELRTPLALLRAELELALRRERTREELEQALRSAADESDRLSRLAEDLLVLARTDEGRLPLRPMTVGARELAERVASRFEQQGAVEVEAPPELMLVADAERIEQALGNLVENALVHGDGPVRIVAEAKNGAVELHVLDEGPGFRDGFAERAFDRFSRADDARSRGGAGLGLAIVRAIARAHGGHSGARSRPETRGADVWIALPP